MAQPERLGDHVEVVTGFPFRSDEYSESGTRLLRGDNIGQGKLRWVGAKRWPEERVAESARFALNAGDVVLAMDRPWIEAGLKYAAVTEHDLPSLLVQRVARLRAKGDLVQPFLRYLIGSRSFTDYILGVQTGTGIPHISVGQIRDYRFAWVPVDEQRAIAEVLGALDDKIVLNERIAETSLVLAQSLYDRCASDSLDWREWKLKDAATWSSGGTPKTGEPSYWNGDIPWISAASLKTPWLAESARSVTPLGVQNGTRLAPKGAILFVVRGMSLTSEFRIGVAQRELAFGQDCKALIPHPSVDSTALFFAIRSHSPKILEMVDLAGHGTGRLVTDRIANLVVRLPQGESIRQFTDGIGSLARAASSAIEENRTLTDLRDTLLPQLVTGKLRVKDATRVVEEAV
ncbi:restriction endonuclease subunit S [Streptomyces sp. NPDC060030]|uniref:restriction endonuclease subunit S n=1 Tax=Streptomyces sp. NPDC060030 TaxID=3347042 RepID=UPI0036BE8517